MMRATSLVGATIVLALSLVMPSPAAGAPILAVSFDNTGVASGSGPDFTIGWRFTTTSPISVSQLAFWDEQGNGFGESHLVGIWTTGGLGTPAAALVTATLTAGTGDSLAAGTWFRVVNVTPIILPAGDYVIGGHLPGTQVDAFKDVSSGINGFAVASGITYVERRLPTVAGFNRPDNTVTGLGMFGPNFTFEVVPEPSSVAVAAIGLAGLTGRAFGRRKPSR